MKLPTAACSEASLHPGDILSNGEAVLFGVGGGLALVRNLQTGYRGQHRVDCRPHINNVLVPKNLGQDALHHGVQGK
jgi:hypothetical protein